MAVVHRDHRQRLAAARVRAPGEPPHPEGHPHDHTPVSSCPRGLHRDDRRLGDHEEPPLGAHLVTPRLAYAHHGVYVGGGAVVHYAAFAKLWRRGPVEEISLAHFAERHPVWVRPARPGGLSALEIVRRARSRLGEDRYRFFTNNCEHLTEWCVNGVHRSRQVERWAARLRRLSLALRDLRRSLTPAPLRGRDCRYLG